MQGILLPSHCFADENSDYVSRSFSFFSFFFFWGTELTSGCVVDREASCGPDSEAGCWVGCEAGSKSGLRRCF